MVFVGLTNITTSMIVLEVVQGQMLGVMEDVPATTTATVAASEKALAFVGSMESSTTTSAL